LGASRQAYQKGSEQVQVRLTSFRRALVYTWSGVFNSEILFYWGGGGPT
jgi:hypothetical protein